jgi:hypothetical protein
VTVDDVTAANVTATREVSLLLSCRYRNSD